MKNCDVCKLVNLNNNHYLLLEANYWNVYLADQQDYPGRCFVPLKRHIKSFSELSNQELIDFRLIIFVIETIYKKYLGASHLNFSLLLNGAYTDPEPNPHVHFHIIPRYSEDVEFGGMVFHDTNYGTNYRIDNEWSLNNNGREEILYILGDKIKHMYKDNI